MQKQKISYTSPLDSILSLAKRLSVFEEKHKLSSEDFFDQFQKGLLGDELDFIEWANDYQNLLALKFEVS